MSQRILITGGLGYVGGRIAKHLVENTDHQIILTTRKKNLPHLKWLENCKIRALDLADENFDLNVICKNVDCVIHLAALNEIVCADHPEQALRINGEGSLRLLNAAIKNGVKRFIYFSTAHVYGPPLVGHLTEQSLPRPSHPYAITHKVAEDFVLAAHDKQAIEGVVLRLSNSFGAPVFPDVDRWTLLLNELAKQVVTTKKITLKSAGTQYRDFIPLTDVCRAVEHIIGLSRAQLDDGLFNLGRESLRVIDVVQQLIHICEQMLKFKPVLEIPIALGQRMDEPKLEFDCSKLFRTGFQPRQKMDSELQELLSFCNKHFGK